MSQKLTLEILDVVVKPGMNPQVTLELTYTHKGMTGYKIAQMTEEMILTIDFEDAITPLSLTVKGEK
jgi:hypothetical protein